MTNNTYALIGFMLLPGLLACAHAPPSDELVKARQAYSNAESGPATALDPADLHEARVALDNAEWASNRDPQSFDARQRSYLALRRAELADAQGKTAAAAQARDASTKEERDLKDALLGRTQDKLAASRARNQQVSGALVESQGQLANSQGELAASQGQLADANQAQRDTQAQLETERQARLAAEKTAMDALAKLGAVKNDERGLVLTLSGSVVFASNKSILLPAAARRLDDVANALRDSPRGIRIEGHTDSIGSDATNQSLSQKRAEAVMNYLISKDIPAARISAVGFGASHPIADNGSSEGRANNRRVEIVLVRAQTASNDPR